MNKTVLTLLMLFLGVFLCGCGQQTANNNPKEENMTIPAESARQKIGTASSRPKTWSLAKPEMEIYTSREYRAVLKTTEGDITIKLLADKTPITVNNFIYLAKQKLYDDTVFHRVMKGFMIQGGDPNGDGTGGPGYRFDDEPFTGEYTKGTVAMANAGPDTNGSQFFIMHDDYPLSPDYVIFGQVESGINVVDKIATAPVEFNASGEKSKPINPVIVQSVEIISE